jgi:hypothetical protein
MKAFALSMLSASLLASELVLDLEGGRCRTSRRLEHGKHRVTGRVDNATLEEPPRGMLAYLDDS